MELYKRIFEDEEQSSNSLDQLTDISIPQKIVDFIRKNPFPQDHTQWHTFAEGLGLDPAVLEQYAYAMLTVIFTGGKSKGDSSEISQEQLDIGMKIEQEHVKLETDNLVVKAIQDIFALKITSDHNAENDKYYLGSVNFKNELKQEGK
jgi:hypothetical protein